MLSIKISWFTYLGQTSAVQVKIVHVDYLPHADLFFNVSKTKSAISQNKVRKLYLQV